jgi:hypothetical protein
MANTKLSLRPIGTAGEGPSIRNWTTVIQYEVYPLPPDERILISNFGGQNEADWRIMRIKDGIEGKWTGSYRTEHDALAAIQEEF